MRFNIRARTVAIGKRSRDVIAELRNRGITVSESQYSSALNGMLTGKKADIIIEVADRIITEWENVQ